jgi:glycosyltransferase involved in cell wall biosynthesis
MSRIISGFNQDRVAFVHDALAIQGGAEKTLSAMLELFPNAPVYTLVYDQVELRSSPIAGHRIVTSPLNRLPRIHRHYRSFLPCFPFLVEGFDLKNYQVVISSSYAAVHGVITDPDQLHIAYLYTPMRHAWHDYNRFVRHAARKSAFTALAARLVLHYFRLWDTLAAQRPDQIIAASHLVADRVNRYYRRSAQVIYPPVDVERFKPADKTTFQRSYYLVISRLRPHKKVSLIVEAFNHLGLPLLVVGEGVELEHISRAAGPNIRFLGRQLDERMPELFARAKALVHAAEEDFGITIVEAQAAGCPAIAFGKGGAVETILPDVTGILFPEQSVDSLVEGVERFELNQSNFKSQDLYQNASRFSKANFQDKFLTLISNEADQKAVDLRLGRRLIVSSHL